MNKTILIEQTAASIKAIELAGLIVSFSSLASGVGLLYIAIPPGFAMFCLTGLSFLGFLGVRIWCWGMRG